MAVSPKHLQLKRIGVPMVVGKTDCDTDREIGQFHSPSGLSTFWKRLELVEHPHYCGADRSNVANASLD